MFQETEVAKKRVCCAACIRSLLNPLPTESGSQQKSNLSGMSFFPDVFADIDYEKFRLLDYGNRYEDNKGSSNGVAVG